MSSLLTFALVIAAAFADPLDLENGACAQFTLKAATFLSFNGAATTIESGDGVGFIGISPGNGLSGSVTIAPEKILINTQETTDCDSTFTTTFNQAMALPCDAANNFPELSSKTLSPGVYCSGSSMKISDTFVTLDGNGDPNAQFVFQVPTALTTAPSTFFVLQNEAQSKNVFWALGTSATIGTSSSFVGNIMAQTQVSFGSDSVLNGRVLANTAIVFESGSNVHQHNQPSVTALKKTNVKLSTADAFEVDKCANFAVNAGTAVNFNGDVTRVTGTVGVAPGEVISGNFEFTGSSSTERNTIPAMSCASETRALLTKAQDMPCAGNHTIQGNDLAGGLFTPGVYCSATGKFTFSAATITLDARGDPNARFTFRTETSLTTSTATSFKLINSAKASNVFWAVGTSATLGRSSNFVGTIIAGEAVTVGTSAVVDGRALALTAVTFSDQGVISLPN